jgi:hypothetical protein
MPGLWAARILDYLPDRPRARGGPASVSLESGGIVEN